MSNSQFPSQNTKNTLRKYKNVFITVGTTRFDKLCDYILTNKVLNALKALGCERIIFQIGSSNNEPGCYEKNGVKLALYRYKDSLDEDYKDADLVISHAGAGSCLEALEARKPLLVVVNEDLMDNHQLELAEQLQVDGNLYYCTCDTIVQTLQEVDFSMLVPLPKANPTRFIKYLDSLFVYNNKNK